MFVGEAPGANEDKEGKPFIGDAGKVLDRALSQAGLARSNVYITNTVKCRPPQNRTPEQKESDACMRYLLEEIEAVQPKIIVALGGAALKALTGKTKITQERGKLHPPKKGLYFDTQITATLHPASTLYGDGGQGGGVKLTQIIEDLRFARSVVEGAETSAGHDIRLATPMTPDAEVANELYQLAESPYVAVDLEWTDGRDKDRMIWPWTREGEVYSVSVTGRLHDGLRSVPIAWPPGLQTRSELVSLLRSRPVIFHNAMADVLWMLHERLPVKVGGDTMLLANLVDETQRLGLEAVAPRYSSEVQAGWKGGTVANRPQDERGWQRLLTYNAEDTRATFLAFEGLHEAINAQPPERATAIKNLHNHLFKPSLAVLAKAAYIGVPIDVPQLKIEHDASKARQWKAAEELAAEAGITPPQAIKLANSSDQTKAYLQGLGIDLESANKNMLADVVDAFPQVSIILRIRSEQKLLSTYLGPWMSMLTRQGDGRLHTIYRLTGTRTGRLSAEVEEGGSLQVTPRAPWVRALIKAPPGRKIVSADFATVEMRVAAWLAGDRAMMEVFKNDPLTSEEPNGKRSDIHKTTAAFIKAQAEGQIDLANFLTRRDVYEATVTKDERQGAKGANFGLIFGMQPASFRDYARINYGVKMTPEQALSVHTSYFTLYADLKPWHDRSRNGAISRGYTETPFGRRRQFDPQDANAAINTPVQSTASDFTFLSISYADRLLREERLNATVIGFVHDSILVDASEEHAERAAQVLVYAMEHVDTSPFGFKIPLPLPADVKIGDTWA